MGNCHCSSVDTCPH